jgi:hypothetical protein
MVLSCDEADGVQIEARQIDVCHKQIMLIRRLDGE